MKRVYKSRIKGFTIAEVLVTLALTSIAITFSYTSLSYVQNLFHSYKKQNLFLQEYTDFKTRMDYEGENAELIIAENDNKFRIFRDSSIIELEILEEVVTLKNSEQCDTFHFAPKKIRMEFEIINNALFKNKLLKSLYFEIDYTKQKFNFYFYKKYDSYSKLKLEENY